MKRFIFLIFGCIFLISGGYIGKVSKTENIGRLSDLEMKQIYAGQPCGGACVDNGKLCSDRSCKEEGGTCSYCWGSNFAHQKCTSYPNFSCWVVPPSPDECGMLIKNGICKREGLSLRCTGGNWDMETMCPRDRRDGGVCPWLR